MYRIDPTHHSFRYYYPDSQWRPFSMNLAQSSHWIMSPSFCAEILPPRWGHQNRHWIPEWCWNKRHNLSYITVALTGSPSGCRGGVGGGAQWCSIRLTAPRTTWLTLSNRGLIKQESAAERCRLPAYSAAHTRCVVMCADCCQPRWASQRLHSIFIGIYGSW